MGNPGLSFPRNEQNLRLPDTRGMLFGSPTDTDWFIGHGVSREIAWGNYSIPVTDLAFLEAILLDRNGVNIIFSDQIYISAGLFRGSLIPETYLRHGMWYTIADILVMELKMTQQ